MDFEFDVQELEKLIRSFRNALDVSISVLYEDFSVVRSQKNKNPYCRLMQSNKQGLVQCMDSNELLFEKCAKSKKLEFHICYAGLAEIVVPILYENEIVGFVNFGHIKVEKAPMRVSMPVSHLPINSSEADLIYNALPIFEEEKVSAIMDMAEIFANYIVSKCLVKVKSSEDFEIVKKYILDNIDKRMTVQTIANSTHLSKSSLYKTIRKNTGLSVNDYVLYTKIEKTKKLLLETDMSVEAIAEKIGFSTTAYYSFIFKKIVGISPTTYKKHNLNVSSNEKRSVLGRLEKTK